MNNKLDFLVIGSQKCATSWLYDCLKEHPEICLSKDKGELEYIGGDLYKEKGQEWFFSLFDHCKGRKLRGDVSVEYIVNEESPKLIFNHNPDMKFILNVREPSNRAISALMWYRRKGAVLDNEDLLSVELEKAIKNFDKTEYKMLAYDFHDVLYRGLYNKLLEKYYIWFKKENFLIIHYEDIKKDPKETLAKIFTFLGVNNRFVPNSMATQPKKNSNNRLLIKMERLYPKNRILSYLVDKLHQKLPQNKSVSDSEKRLRLLLDEFYESRKENVLIK